MTHLKFIETRGRRQASAANTAREHWRAICFVPAARFFRGQARRPSSQRVVLERPASVQPTWTAQRDTAHRR